MSKRSILAVRASAATSSQETVPVATRCTTGYVTLSDAANTSALYRSFHAAVTDASQLRLVYGNSYGGPTPAGRSPIPPEGGVAPNPDPINVRAAVEFAGGTVPVWFEGERSAVIPPGGVVVSDPIPVKFARGAAIWVRTRVEAKPTTGGGDGRWPVGLLLSKLNSVGSSAEGYEQPSRMSPASDVDPTVARGTPTAIVGSTRAYSPLAILGRVTSSSYRTVLLVGDSIMNGSGEDRVALGTSPLGSGPGSNTLAEQGFAVRALDSAALGYLKVSQPGDRAQWFASTAQHAARLKLARYCDNALCNYGRNDLAAGQTVATTQVNLLRIWTLLQWLGLKTFQTTITPTTTRASATAPEVAYPSNSNRNAVNRWLRDGAPLIAGTTSNTPAGEPFPASAIRAGSTDHPLADVIDIAARVETPTGLWGTTVSGTRYANLEAVAGGSLTAVHPSTAGHLEAAKAVTAALGSFV